MTPPEGREEGVHAIISTEIRGWGERDPWDHIQTCKKRKVPPYKIVGGGKPYSFLKGKLRLGNRGLSKKNESVTRL